MPRHSDVWTDQRECDDMRAFQADDRKQEAKPMSHTPITASERAMRAARALLDEYRHEPTGEECQCSKCGEFVKVPTDYEWADGDICHACWCNFGHRAREIIELVVETPTSPDTEEMRSFALACSQRHLGLFTAEDMENIRRFLCLAANTIDDLRANLQPSAHHRERAEEIVARVVRPILDNEQPLIDAIAQALALCTQGGNPPEGFSWPRTIDGVNVYPGMTMYFSSGVEATVLAVWFDGTLDLQSHENGIPVNDWKRLRAESFGYSTRQAAESASRKDGEQNRGASTP